MSGSGVDEPGMDEPGMDEPGMDEPEGTGAAVTGAELAAIERACHRLVVAYARATDLGDPAAAGALFTEDGVLEMPGGRRFVGRAAIAGRIAAQPPRQVSRHLLSNIAVAACSTDHASGSLLVTMYRGSGADDGRAVRLDGPYLVGEYSDDYRRTPDGWRIAHRRLTTVFRRPDEQAQGRGQS